jgi:hypothetical protein
VNSSLRAYSKLPQEHSSPPEVIALIGHSVANMVLRRCQSGGRLRRFEQKRVGLSKNSVRWRLAFWKASRFRGSPSVMQRENMEILIFGLIASYCTHRQQKWVIAEPEEFRAFDLRALRNSADNEPSQASSRRVAYVLQTA